MHPGPKKFDWEYRQYSSNGTESVDLIQISTRPSAFTERDIIVENKFAEYLYDYFDKTSLNSSVTHECIQYPFYSMNIRKCTF